MGNLFNDPVQWSSNAVGTWPRFCFMAIMLGVLTGIVIYEAAEAGWRAAGGLALLLFIYHLMFLYAMRRMFLMLQARSAPDLTRPHRHDPANSV